MVLVADPAPPKMVRHSTGMMVGGIVMVAIAPIALFVSAGAAVSGSFCRGSYDRSIDGSYYDDCDNDGLIYGSLFVGAALLGAGIPMIIVGAKKEPAKLPAATVAPWATSTAAGLGLRLAL